MILAICLALIGVMYSRNQRGGRQSEGVRLTYTVKLLIFFMCAVLLETSEVYMG